MGEAKHMVCRAMPVPCHAVPCRAVLRSCVPWIAAPCRAKITRAMDCRAVPYQDHACHGSS